MIIAFTGLRQNREGRRRGHPQRSGLVLADCSLAALAREGISRSPWVLLILSLLSNTIPVTFAHSVHDSHCTSFLPLFISSLLVASSPKLY